MKRLVKIAWCYMEVLYAKLCFLLGIKKDESVIPEGPYCYVWDEEGQKEETREGVQRIKLCKYYRHADQKAACTFVGFIGWDPCLSDQCKICGVKSVNDE